MKIHRSVLFAGGLMFTLSISPVLIADSEVPDYNPRTKVLTMPVVTQDGAAAFNNVILDLDFAAQTFAVVSLERVTRSPLDLESLGEGRYRFEADAGESYVVELYDVARSYESVSGFNCSSNSRRTGLGFRVSDPLGTAVVTQCAPNGFGNVYSQSLFEAGLSGTYEIEVLPNDANATGPYRIRVQPGHDHPGASWSPGSFEPNNRDANAYGIRVGFDHSLQSILKERNSSFAANFSDRDWYRFTATVGRTYFVELFNADRSFQAESGFGCNSSSRRSGIGLVVRDPTFTDVATRCSPSGSGNVHNAISFKAGISGTFYVGVLASSETSAGRYRIRVLADHGDPEASWSLESHEPNNQPLRAFPLEIGQENVIHSRIQELNSSYSTNAPDFDWYRIEAAASTTYEIQLLNASGLFESFSGFFCNNNSRRSGLGLVVLDSTEAFLTSQCGAVSSGNIDNSLTFRSGLAGVYYIGVLPNGLEGDGPYSIRVLRR